MVAQVKALNAKGTTIEEAAKEVGFANGAQYYYHASRLGALPDTHEKQVNWIMDYEVAPLPKLQEPMAEIPPRAIESATIDRLREKEHTSLLIMQMRLVQDLSKTCIVASDMATLSDTMIRLAEHIQSTERK
jgi:hypothetical protein